MTNSLSDDIYALGQLMADNLNTVGVSDADVDDGLTTLANKILQASPSKINTVLSLDTPLVVYTDLFTVNGTLLDDEDNPIENATIQLIWNDGSEHIATDTTDEDGVFSFTSTDPASVSSYSFQLFFAGDNDYNASNSSVVNVDTVKETSVMVITHPASGAVVSNSAVMVSGTLKDNDGTAMSGKSVSFSLNGSGAGTATVGSTGSFSKTITGLTAGSNSITVSFAATTTHTTASQSITVYRATFDDVDIDLSDGSLILSYADEVATPDSQYAEFTAQLTLNDSPASISGVDIEFYKDGVLWDTIASDGNGQATKTYHSLGSGDVEVYAKVGSLLTKTYSIQDCNLYYTTEIYKSGQDMQYLLFNDFSLANTGNWEMTCDLKTNKSFIALTPCSNESMSTNNCLIYTGVGANTTGAKLCALGFDPVITDGVLWNTSGTFGSSYVTVKITKVGNKYTFYYDGSELTNTTSSDFSAQTPLYLVTRHSGSGANCYVKNIKVKPL